MKKYEKLKVGDFVKCVNVSNANKYTTINKLYKIEEFIGNRNQEKNGIYERMTVHIIDDKRFPVFLNLYEKIYMPTTKVSYNVFFKNFFKILAGKYFPTYLSKETIWFVPATKLEIEMMKYNL